MSGVRERKLRAREFIDDPLDRVRADRDVRTEGRKKLKEELQAPSAGWIGEGGGHHRMHKAVTLHIQQMPLALPTEELSAAKVPKKKLKGELAKQFDQLKKRDPVVYLQRLLEGDFKGLEFMVLVSQSKHDPEMLNAWAFGKHGDPIDLPGAKHGKLSILGYDDSDG